MVCPTDNMEGVVYFGTGYPFLNIVVPVRHVYHNNRLNTYCPILSYDLSRFDFGNTFDIDRSRKVDIHGFYKNSACQPGADTGFLQFPPMYMYCTPLNWNFSLISPRDSSRIIPNGKL